MDMPNLIKLCAVGGRGEGKEGEGGAGGREGCLQLQSKSYHTFLMLLCIRFKLRQALTLLFSVFVLRFYKGKKIFKQMRTRLIKMKVLASTYICPRSFSELHKPENS